ncbi:MAG: thiolase family protein [Clostridia bacterium]|nr:thiolase family protein [Clostridia bacterium]
MKEAVIVSAVRTPVGKYGGMLANYKDYELGAMVIKEAVRRCHIHPNDVDDVYFGNLLGIPGNIAKVSAVGAGLPETIPAVTIDRQCASGVEAISVAAAMIQSGNGSVYIAGGAESMTNKPYYLEKSHKPYSVRPPRFLEAMFVPAGMEDPGMGETAENVLDRYTISREEMDTFALNSHKKAIEAIEKGEFDEQILPVPVKIKQEEKRMMKDECPRKDTHLEKLLKLSPLFRKGGSVTAGNSCPMNDGAAAVILMDKEKAEKDGVSYMGTVKGFASVGLDHKVMGLGPIYAVRKLLEKTGLKMDDIDLFELNEAFAAQSIACIRELGLDIAKVNINGGAIALGHPLGATGTILAIKLLHALKKSNARYGIVTMCIGGGQGAALLLENTK